MIACGKVDFTNVGVLPIPPLTFCLVTTFNVLNLNDVDLHTVDVEVPVIGYVVSTFTYRTCLKQDANGRILSNTDGSRDLRSLTDSTY